VGQRPARVEDLGVKNCFGGAYADRHVFLTGHTGFKGSWLALWLEAMGAKVTGFALNPADDPNAFGLLKPAGHDFRGNLRDFDALGKALCGATPDLVIHMAAQALVRRSYRDTRETYETNVIGTVNLLEAVRVCPSVRGVVVVTSDKVYRNHEWPWSYRESDELGGHDPYSCSKSCAELVTASYRNTIFRGATPLVASARAGNVIGGGDWAEDRLIPDMARAAAQGKELDVRNPTAIRPWQHVLEPLSGYLMLGQRLLGGDAQASCAWNFGPGQESHAEAQTVLQAFSRHWSKTRWRPAPVANSSPEAMLLKLDHSLARQRLGWRPVWDLECALKATADWYRTYYESRPASMREHSLKDISRYTAEARTQGLSWAASAN
jgi:CDP-glucose 4,6-dehydratase